MQEELILAMEDLEEEKVLALVGQMRDGGTDVIDIMRALNRGMYLVGKRFEMGRYFLADLIVSGAIYRGALELMNPYSFGGRAKSTGRILIGVVKNDIHDIGKDIISISLSSEGFEVIDLGVDVSCDAFMDAVLKYRPDIIALSGTMTFAADEMGKIIARLSELGLEKKIRVIVGGTCVTERIAQKIKADHYSEDPIETIAICNKLMGKT